MGFGRYHFLILLLVPILFSVSIPTAFAQTVSVPAGTSVPGCEQSNECFLPARITVNVGATVTWTNDDTAAHTVTSGAGAAPDGHFDSSLFMAGTSFDVTFPESGTFDYFCMVHPWMLGTVIVGGTAPPPTPYTPVFDTIAPKILRPSDVIVDATDSNGARVTYEVLAIDDTDQIVRPSCSPLSGSFFSIGDTKVVCNASDSAGNSARPITFTVTVNALGILIPNWIKEVAAFWCDDKIDDASFIEGIQYLIDNGIIIVSASTSGSGGTQDIPSWIKNNACWWSNGQISDEDFASGLEFLVSQGIIRV